MTVTTIHITKLWKVFCIILLLCCTALSSIAQAGEAEWELGIGITAMDIPYYPGSAENKSYVFPIPHILYRSEKLEIDNGIDATFLKTQRIRLNLSADLAVPVNSKDSTARNGMPDLDLVIQIGPTLEITLAGGRFKPRHLRLELPVRAAVATDFGSAEHVGWVFEPRVTYESRRPYKTGFAHLISAGLRFSSQELHEYYYDVKPTFVTPVRPAFESAAGYSGLFLDYIANWRTDELIYFALLRYQNLAGAAYEDSPLIEQEDYLLVGVGVTWVFARNL